MSSNTYLNTLIEAAKLLAKDSDKERNKSGASGSYSRRKDEDKKNNLNIEYNSKAHGNSSRSSSRKTKNMVHNVLERNRRALLKERLNKLRQVLPKASTLRIASVACVLKEATEIIEELRNEEESCMDEKTTLQRRKKFLQNKLEALMQSGKEYSDKNRETQIGEGSTDNHVAITATQSSADASLVDNSSYTVSNRDAKTNDVGVNTDFPDNLDSVNMKVSQLARISNSRNQSNS
eukprot:gene13740-15174_t